MSLISNYIICTVQKTIAKVRSGEITTWGPVYNIESEADFEAKLHQFSLVSNEIKQLDLELKECLKRAMDGKDPELVI